MCIRLPYAAVFERQGDLPAHAGAHARSILDLERERAMPFKASDVYVADIITASPTRKGWLSASQIVVKRKVVEKAIAELKAYDLSVAHVDCMSADGTSPLLVNFLAVTGSSPPRPASRPARSIAAVLVIGLAASASYIALSRREAALDGLEREVATARSRAEIVRREQGQVDAAIAGVAAVRALKTSRVAVVNRLDELTRLLPDDVVLNDLKFDGDTIDLSGFAKSAAALVPVLERSVMFKDATLTAPVAFDAAVDKERVSVRIRLRAAMAAAPANPQPETTP